MKKSSIQHSNTLEESELILNPDGSVYHLHLLPEHVADTVILVGDQGRVSMVSSFFDQVDYKIHNREFVTHTGTYKGKRVTAMSTGIGTDNIDIAINELDAAVNIDLKTSTLKNTHKKLKLIRIGTSGALQEDIPVDSFALSEYGLGFDGLLHYYQPNYEADELELAKAFETHYQPSRAQTIPYAVKASPSLVSRLEEGMIKGITATASGFYAPQGRSLRLATERSDQNERLNSFRFGENRIINFEMETAALYGIGTMLGHDCCTVCAVIANRFKRSYSKDYQKTVRDLVQIVLDRVCTD